MNKKDKNTIYILIIVAIILISVSSITYYLSNETNEKYTLQDLNNHLENNVTNFDKELVNDVELYGIVHPDESGASELRVAIKNESDSTFKLGIIIINTSINEYNAYDPSLMKYITETNETYKNITNLRLEYKFGNITTEEFKTKINEYYYNGNPLLQQLIKPFN